MKAAPLALFLVLVACAGPGWNAAATGASMPAMSVPAASTEARSEAAQTVAPDDPDDDLAVPPSEEADLVREDSGKAFSSLDRLCTDFVAEAAEEGAAIAKTFSFHQHSPRCRVTPAPSAFVPSATFLDARTVEVARVSREESRLALKLARGWILTSVAWDVADSENATPMWGVRAPDRMTATGASLIVYLGGDDRRAPTGDRSVLGAYACRDEPPTLGCWRWDPTEQEPLGIGIGNAQARPSKQPWKRLRTLEFGRDGRPRVAARVH